MLADSYAITDNNDSDYKSYDNIYEIVTDIILHD